MATTGLTTASLVENVTVFENENLCFEHQAGHDADRIRGQRLLQQLFRVRNPSFLIKDASTNYLDFENKCREFYGRVSKSNYLAGNCFSKFGNSSGLCNSSYPIKDIGTQLARSRF